MKKLLLLGSFVVLGCGVSFAQDAKEEAKKEPAIQTVQADNKKNDNCKEVKSSSCCSKKTSSAQSAKSEKSCSKDSKKSCCSKKSEGTKKED